MKKVKKGAFWEKILCFSATIVLTSALTAGILLLCGNRKGQATGPDTEAVNIATLEARVGYYETRIEGLESDLTEAKRQLYIAETDYRVLLKEYEGLVTSGTPTQPLATEEPGTPPPTDTGKDNENPGTKEPSVIDLSDTSDPPAETPHESVPTPTDIGDTPEEPGAGILYTVKNQTVTVTGYAGDATSLTIPATLAGLPVAAIADNAFLGTDLQTICVADGIETVGWFAFGDSPRLQSVTLPASVTSIGYEAFRFCPALTLRGPDDCYAQRYAASYGLAWQTINDNQ